MRAFVGVHLDPRLVGRVDPSDVVLEAQLEIVRRLDDFLKRQAMPFHLWVQRTAYQRFIDFHRHHLQRARRSATCEVAWPDRSSLLLARPLLDARPSPSSMLRAQALAERVGRAVAELADADREIVLLRDVDQLPYEEIACPLEIEPIAARKPYGRALIRLQKLLTDHGLLE